MSKSASFYWPQPNNSFKPTPCRGVGLVLCATLARVRRPATGRLNSGVRHMDEALSTLKDEFDACDGSFLSLLRIDLVWSEAAFTRLTNAMQSYLVSDREEDCLERWVAEGFWYLSHFVRDWTSHDNFPKEFSAAYYESAYERLYEFSYWLFVGESPYQAGKMLPEVTPSNA
jgi:hypothetical protein